MAVGPFDYGRLCFDVASDVIVESRGAERKALAELLLPDPLKGANVLRPSSWEPTGLPSLRSRVRRKLGARKAVPYRNFNVVVFAEYRSVRRADWSYFRTK